MRLCTKNEYIIRGALFLRAYSRPHPRKRRKNGEKALRGIRNMPIVSEKIVLVELDGPCDANLRNGRKSQRANPRISRIGSLFTMGENEGILFFRGYGDVLGV